MSVRAIPAVVLLLAAMPGVATAQANTGTAQGGGLLNAGGPLVVTAVDAHSQQLVRGRKPGPGRMTIRVERDSELAKLLRAQLAASPRRAIPRVHLEFNNVTFYVPEADRSAPASAVRTVLQEVTVVRMADSNASGRPVSDVTITFTGTSWSRGYPIKWQGPEFPGHR